MYAAFMLGVLAAMAAWFVASGGMRSGMRGDSGLTILSWNVQNLFDSEEDGREYPSFSPAAGWDEDRYHERLVRVSEVLRRVRPRPDVIALQEIEDETVIVDLLSDYFRSPFAAVVPPGADGTIRVALLSRLPVSDVRVHRSAAMIAVPGSSPVLISQSRDIIDAGILSNARRTRVLVSHWKSQSGGERETEEQRIQTAALIGTVLRAAKAAESDLLAVVVGDLNEDVLEYVQQQGRYTTALVPVQSISGISTTDRARVIFVTANAESAGIGDEVIAFSPWLDPGHDPGMPGSYYHERWERLDQVLLVPLGSAGAAAAASTGLLTVLGYAELQDSRGRPFRYDVRTGRGVSDHFPILFRLGSQSDQRPSSTS